LYEEGERRYINGVGPLKTRTTKQEPVDIRRRRDSF
jgi:hypothetical protein